MLIDVNVLVYAHRTDSPEHAAYRTWLEDTVTHAAGYGLADLVLSGFIRVVTNPRVFDQPTPIERAIQEAAQLRARSNCRRVAPGGRHWQIFTELCESVGARGNLVADAYLAALAIESGGEWISADRDFARFPGLRCRHPLR